MFMKKLHFSKKLILLILNIDTLIHNLGYNMCTNISGGRI